MNVRSIGFAIFVAAALAVSACSATPHPVLTTVEHVDLERFMGDWYVIASIPTPIEHDAYNSVESYALDPDGTFRTTLTFREGAFGGEEKQYTTRGYVVDQRTKAIWSMELPRLAWSTRVEHRILYLSDDYSHAIIGRDESDHVWILSRTPTMSKADYGRLARFLVGIDYDVSKLRRVPQRWN